MTILVLTCFVLTSQAVRRTICPSAVHGVKNDHEKIILDGLHKGTPDDSINALAVYDRESAAARRRPLWPQFAGVELSSKPWNIHVTTR